MKSTYLSFILFNKKLIDFLLAQSTLEVILFYLKGYNLCIHIGYDVFKIGFYFYQFIRTF